MRHQILFLLPLSPKGRWPLLWPGWTAPKEWATWDQAFCVGARVCAPGCVTVNRSRRPPIIALSEWAVGRNWRRGPQLSSGLVGSLRWLTDPSHAPKGTWADVASRPPRVTLETREHRGGQSCRKHWQNRTRTDVPEKSSKLMCDRHTLALSGKVVQKYALGERTKCSLESRARLLGFSLSNGPNSFWQIITLVKHL